MQVFVRENCTMIAAPVQCDVDGIAKGSHSALLKRPNVLVEAQFLLDEIYSSYIAERERSWESPSLGR
jgi:hypothetical protein